VEHIVTRNPNISRTFKALWTLTLVCSVVAGLTVGNASGAVTTVDTMTVFAGTGAADPVTGGSSGPATETPIGKPSAVAFDSTGRLLIADAENGRIRAVSDGSVVPLTVPPSLGGARGMAAGSGGEVYVADSANGDLWQRTASSWTALGQDVESRPLSGPSDVAVHPATNDVYVADTGNNRILKRQASTGAWTRIAGLLNGGTTGGSRYGTGIARDHALNRPSGLAFRGNELLIADSGNHAVLGVDIGDGPASGQVTRLVGAPGTEGSEDGSVASAKLHSPVDVAVRPGAGPDDGFFIADQGPDQGPEHDLVREVSGGASPLVTTRAGSRSLTATPGDGESTERRLSNPASIAIDRQNVIYIADTDANVVRAVVRTAAPAAGGSPPSSPIAPPPESPPARADQPELGTAAMVEEESTGLPSPAEPVVGKRASVQPAGGRVRIRLPGREGFLNLVGKASIPVGSIVDTRRGKVRLTTAANRSGKTQTAVLWGGVFKLRQKRARRPVTELAMRGSASSCPAGRSAGTAHRFAQAARRGKARRLWGRGHGRFRTRGHHGAATVRGTIWGVFDTCKGTRVKVRRGVVAVDDFARGRRVLVRAGGSYLARAVKSSRRHRSSRRPR